jgi:thiol-disulfide isomerase/thioredoxin
MSGARRAGGMRTNAIRSMAVGAAIVLLGATGYGLLHANAKVSPKTTASLLSNGGPQAPDFTGISDWENSSPLTMHQLRGRVVLVDFWTYSCINCQRTFPFLESWWHRYGGSGLVIVGVHSPEYEFEKNISNVRQAIQRYHVDWPVAVDSQMATWNAYQNLYWPAEYLIDKTGVIRHTESGEGGYGDTEAAIQLLLRDAGYAIHASAGPSIDPGLTRDANLQTVELYGGNPDSIGNEVSYPPGQPFDFHDPGTISTGRHQANLIFYQGRWSINLPEEGDHAQHARASPPGQDYALINYRARRVYMVAAASGSPERVYLRLDGADLKPSDAGSDVKFDSSGRSYADIDRSDNFSLVNRTDFTRHELTVSPTGTGFQLFSFTFGS